jgi:large subunit ribosomal protein L10
MPTAHKAEMIDELEQKLRDAKGAVVLDYRGLSVAAISALRRDLVKDNVEFMVAKNTLVRIAAERAQVDVSPDLISGPTAIAFGMTDEVTPARLLRDFTRRNRIVSIKGAVVSGRSMTAEEVGRLADLPSKETLLAQFLGALQAPMAQTLGVLQAPAREVAGLALALSEKLQASGEAA